MIHTKTYSAYMMNVEQCEPFFTEFLEKNGFEFKSLITNTQQTDARSFLQNITVVYEDYGKSKIFDNKYDPLRDIKNSYQTTTVKA